MENLFKKIRHQSNALMEQKDPLAKTFEGALFSSSGWFLFSETSPVQVAAETVFNEPVKAAPLEEKIPEISAPVESKNYAYEVLFMGDTYDGAGEDLLGKMIAAMKLKESEFIRVPLDQNLENVEDLEANLILPDPSTALLFKTITEKRPRVVVALGATITNILLGKREKLSGIHGQFFEREINGEFFTLMPVFHPEFLMINPNMKRTAWIDLQKVMARIGKI